MPIRHIGQKHITSMSSSLSGIGCIHSVAGLFLYFLKRNRLLLRKDGSKRIADHTLVALTVMIAESKPAEKEMMVNLVMTFLA